MICLHVFRLDLVEKEREVFEFIRLLCKQILEVWCLESGKRFLWLLERVTRVLKLGLGEKLIVFI